MYISTEHILSVIDEHAESTALLLLPGIRTYFIPLRPGSDCLFLSRRSQPLTPEPLNCETPFTIPNCPPLV